MYVPRNMVSRKKTLSFSMLSVSEYASFRSGIRFSHIALRLAAALIHLCISRSCATFSSLTQNLLKHRTIPSLFSCTLLSEKNQSEYFILTCGSASIHLRMMPICPPRIAFDTGRLTFS